jgi:hypothetical protein
LLPNLFRVTRSIMVHRPTMAGPLYSAPSLPKFSQFLLIGCKTISRQSHHHKL